MGGRRLLLMHISPGSGHQRASYAVEQALRAADPDGEVTSVDASQYVSRPIRWAIAHTYRSLIRHQPDIWEYLYDNPSVHRRVEQFRALAHRYHSSKFGRMLETLQPDVIACTQAYPCGMVADFKRRYGLRTPLVGILTDYAPHVYWFHETVDHYVVPSAQVKARFLARGIAPARVHPLGIPIDPRFGAIEDRDAIAQQYGVDPTQPIILMMGGGSGFGPLREIIQSLDVLPQPYQLIVVTGSNHSLLRWIRVRKFRHRVRPVGYVHEIPRLMSLATMLISKPGGLTCAEALAKQVPLVIVNPIPGQEAYNARYLLGEGVAVQVAGPPMVRQTVRDLLENPERLAAMRERASTLARPHAAAATSALVLGLTNHRQSDDERDGQRIQVGAVAE